jgi:hypothetical protein
MADPKTHNPESYFGLKGCFRCLDKPCRHLRRGGVRPGKTLLVHRHAALPDTCPFAPHSARDVRLYLERLDDYALRSLYHTISGSLTAAEQWHAPARHALGRDRDSRAVIDYILTLWMQRIVRMVRIPFSYERDQRIRRWLHAYDGALKPTLGERHVLEETGRALTDDLDDQADEQTIAIQNPRWEHVDKEKQQNQPESARPGDTITLMADISGAPEGVAVTFDLFDCRQAPPQRFDTVKGKHEKGIGKAEWTVSVPNDEGEPDVQFEAIVRSKSTPKCEVAIEVEEFVISI